MASAGGEANRTGGPMPNLGGRDDGEMSQHRLARGASEKPAPVEEGRPTFTREELASFTPDPDAAGEDDDTVAKAKKLVDSKLMTPEEATRHYGLTTKEAVALTGRAKPVRKSLAELRALRKTDPKRYWSPEIQAQELAELAWLSGAAGPPSRVEAEPDGEEPAGDDELSQVGARLKEIAAAVTRLPHLSLHEYDAPQEWGEVGPQTSRPKVANGSLVRHRCQELRQLALVELGERGGGVAAGLLTCRDE